MTRVQSEKPPVGTRVRCYFGGNHYPGEVVRYGKSEPVVRFKLRNGKAKEGRATILPHGAALGVTYSGYLASLYAAEPKPAAELAEAVIAARNARPVIAARTDVLFCVCGTTWKPKPGETLRQLAERLGGGFYPSTTSREGLNYVCPECDSEGT